MGKAELKSVIEKKIKDAPKIDYIKRKNDWIAAVDDFYKKVRKWLDGIDIKYKDIPIEIIEEGLGSYNINKLILSIANEIVTLEPVGAVLIGSIGRIDMKGKNGTVKFVLVDKEAIEARIFPFSDKKDNTIKKKKSKYEWKIATKPPYIKYLNLDDSGETFADYLKALIE